MRWAMIKKGIQVCFVDFVRSGQWYFQEGKKLLIKGSYSALPDQQAGVRKKIICNL